MAQTRGVDLASDKRELARLDDHERSVLAFEIKWAHFGGPTDEETIPEFGLRARDLRKRYERILATYSARHLLEADRHLVERATIAFDAFHSATGASSSTTVVV